MGKVLQQKAILLNVYVLKNKYTINSSLGQANNVELYTMAGKYLSKIFMQNNSN